MALKKTTRELKNEEHRINIHTAAAALFCEYSFDRVTVDDICALAGVGKSTFYNLYDSKDDLMMISTAKERFQYIEDHYHYDEAIPFLDLLKLYFRVNFGYVLNSGREKSRLVYRGYMSTGKSTSFPPNVYVDELYRLVDRGLAEKKLCANLSREEYWQLMSDTMIGCFIGWSSRIKDEPGLDEKYLHILDGLVDSLVREP